MGFAPEIFLAGSALLFGLAALFIGGCMQASARRAKGDTGLERFSGGVLLLLGTALVIFSIGYGAYAWQLKPAPAVPGDLLLTQSAEERVFRE
jgi:hypothetical protein